MFDLEESQRRAEQRLGLEGARQHHRRPRSDRGRSRVSPKVLDRLHEALGGQAKPSIREVLLELAHLCREKRIACPSRATVYKLLETIDTQDYRMRELPPAVRLALYNLGAEAVVPGRQVAFYCFNYGDLDAVCFAASLPWLPLYQAARMRGWRPKSRGLLEAVCRVRRI